MQTDRLTIGLLPMTHRVKNPPAVHETQEMRVRFLGWEDPLEEEMATRSTILAWKNPTDRGAWLSTFHGFTKSRTQLSE